jgi:hypothetical protein
MVDRDEQARRHDEENRAEFAIRRQEKEMESVERALERELKAFEADEEKTKRRISDQWRSEHWGREPEHPPAWEKSRTSRGE